MSNDPTLAEALEAYCSENGKSRIVVMEDMAERREWVRWMKNRYPFNPTPESTAEAMRLLNEAGVNLGRDFPTNWESDRGTE